VKFQRKAWISSGKIPILQREITQKKEKKSTELAVVAMIYNVQVLGNIAVSGFSPHILPHV
jgi:hypothetical protein